MANNKQNVAEKAIEIYQKVKNAQGLVATLGGTATLVIGLVFMIVGLVILALIVGITIYLIFSADSMTATTASAQGNPAMYYDSPTQLDDDGTQYAWPVPTINRISSEFGFRVHPVTGEVGKAHNGIDIANGADKTELQPIYAMADGVVTLAGAANGYGQAIYIQHANGLLTKYGHLDSKMEVSVQQGVKKGQRIGRIGAGKVGSSTGSHLHFQVELEGVPVNPLNYVSPPGETGFGDWKPPASPTGANGVPGEIAYRPLNIEAMYAYLNGRGTMMGDRGILSMIDQAGRNTGVDPYVLLAITGAEQSFVGRGESQAEAKARNPWNVYGCWCKGKGSQLTTEQAAEVAANTIVKLAQNTPAGMNPLRWINQPQGVNPKGYYAADPIWWSNVTKIRNDLYQRAGVIP